MSRKQLFDKYDRPTIHYFVKQRQEAAREATEAAIEDAKAEAEANRPKVDFDGMPLNWEAREYENKLDYKSFLAGDGEVQLSEREEVAMTHTADSNDYSAGLLDHARWLSDGIKDGRTTGTHGSNWREAWDLAFKLAAERDKIGQDTCKQCGRLACEHGEGEAEPNHTFVE
jgi:hypothetical protein